MNHSTVRDNIRPLGDDYLLEYNGIEVSCVTGPEAATIGHFELPEDQRGKGYGSTIMDVFIDLLREEGYRSLSVRIAVTETDSLDDPTVEFLQKHGFSGFTFKDHPDWGYVVRASRDL